MRGQKSAQDEAKENNVYDMPVSSPVYRSYSFQDKDHPRGAMEDEVDDVVLLEALEAWRSEPEC